MAIRALGVQEKTSTIGTGDITLGGAEPGYSSFLKVLGPGSGRKYAIITSSGLRELGEGTIAGNKIVRDNVYFSSNGGNKLHLSGDSTVYSVLPEETVSAPVDYSYYPTIDSLEKYDAVRIANGSVVKAYSSDSVLSTSKTGIFIETCDSKAMVVTRGIIENDAWSWSAGLVFLGSGEIVQTIPVVGTLHVMGYVLDNKTVFIDPKSPISLA